MQWRTAWDNINLIIEWLKDNLEQVVAPKGLDFSHLTTVVMHNHIGFAQLFFSQGTESVAKALRDSNRQDSIFLKAENKQLASYPCVMEISYIHLYLKFHANPAKMFQI